MLPKINQLASLYTILHIYTVLLVLTVCFFYIKDANNCQNAL